MSCNNVSSFNLKILPHIMLFTVERSNNSASRCAWNSLCNTLQCPSLVLQA